MATESFQEDGFDFLIPGARLVHVITVVTDAKIDAALEILKVVKLSGANLEGLSTSRYGQRLDHRLRVSGIGTEKARAVSRHISELAGIRTASIDHHIIARPPEALS